MSMMISQSEDRIAEILIPQQEVTLESAEDVGRNNTSQESNASDESWADTTPEYNISTSNEPHSGTFGVVEGPPARGGHVGRKQATSALYNNKYKELALRNAQVMAHSMRRRVELMEEKNAMAAFAMQEGETEEDKKKRKEFFLLTRSEYLRKLSKRNCISTSSSAPTHPPHVVPTSKDNMECITDAPVANLIPVQ